MTSTAHEIRRQMERLDADSLADHQLRRLNCLLASILPHNRFYGAKLAGFDVPLAGLEALQQLPYTYKKELNPSTNDGDRAVNLTYPIERYVRFHRTSGTRGRPLVVLDTAEDWQWWIDSWQYVLDAADIGPEDRAMMAFSYGPFIGFWSAHDACAARGCLVLPGGGMNTLARLDLIRSSGVTALFCTPSYALHMAEFAADNQMDVANLEVRRIVVAGEPGGSLTSMRNRIQQQWNALVIDHSGASEIGPWGYADPDGKGLYVNESEFIAEFISLETGLPTVEGELAELVLTTLGRVGSPVIRYRTQDLVQPTWDSNGDCRFVLLQRGVLGRVDDMMIIRGVNIYPSSVEQILHSFPEIIEYRMTARKTGEMDVLLIEVEDRLEEPDRISQELQLRLGLKVNVRCVPLGSLPRFEGKGNRFIDKR